MIAVSAPHRAAALAACAEAIDTLKETVPLWKKEVYEGGEEWIGRRAPDASDHAAEGQRSSACDRQRGVDTIDAWRGART